MPSHFCLPDTGHRALRKGRVSVSGRVYHVTAATMRREPFFIDSRAAHQVCRCFENPVLLRDARMLAWVLMPDHAHWLIELGEQRTLQGLVGLLKTFSARNVGRALARHGPIWAPAFHDHALRDEGDIPAAARYIVANPLRAGLAERIGDYPYWNSTFL